MEQLYQLIHKFNKNNIETYFVGSYVYNKIIKDLDDYDDIDIVSQNIDKFESELKKHFNCIRQKIGIGEYTETTFIKLKCNKLKDINLIEDIYLQHNLNLNNRNKRLYDFQRILYNPTLNIFLSFDKKMDIDKVISDYKNNKICYIPTNLREKDINRFNYLKQKNIIECLINDIKKYNIDELKSYYY